jgi:predicted Ser/Thr protein kinase
VTVSVTADDCPDEHVFVELVEARLDNPARVALETHLDGCDACRLLFAELSRMPDAVGVAAEPVLEISTATPNLLPSPSPGVRAQASSAGGKPVAVGRFRVDRVLGEGGMGTVLLGHDPDLERSVAIKILKMGGEDQQLIEEARAQAQLAHPNVVRVYEVGHNLAGVYIAMELIEGETLRAWMKRGQPWRDVIQAFDAAGRGLAAAHRAGLVHRDFKPANVLVGNDGRIAVTDFGLARAVVRKPTTRSGRPVRAPTATGFVSGTPAYLAPERCRGQSASPASDQFAFAISLWEALYGERPFAGDDEDSVVTNILAGTMRERPKETYVPDWLHQIMLRALAADPDARFPSIDAMLDAIHERLSNQSSRRDCPFPGLAPFEMDDSDVYFGRDAEIGEAIRRISDRGFLAVTGPSGSGKSSFVRAGVVPALRRQGRVTPLFIRPGRDPRRALAELVRRVSPELADIDAIVRDPERLGDLLDAHAHETRSRLVLVVDQLEEVFTLSQDDVQQAELIAAIEHIASHRTERVKCIVTLRSDLLERAQRHRTFLHRIVASLMFLGSPDRDTLRDALVRPLARVGYALESPAIADSIANDLDGKPGALPLLQFAGRRLWALADHDQKVITAKAFEGLGEVAGLLAEHASSVIAALPPEDRRIAREIFVRLVTPERTRAVIEIDDLQGLGDKPGDVATVIEALVAGRLVVLHGRDDTRTVELVHEALIDRWPELRHWLDELDRGDELFAEVSEAARRWIAMDRAPGMLWQGELAQRLAMFASGHRGTLTPDERAFVQAAIAGDRRQRRRRRFVLIGAFAALSAMVVGAVIAIIFITDAASTAERAANQARAAELKATEQQKAATIEATRAHAAERTNREQLDALMAEKRQREEAEALASSTNEKLTLTDDELRRTLDRLQKEAVKTREALKDAADAARREREAHAATQRLLEEKKAQLAAERAEGARLNQTLKGTRPRPQ